MATLWITIHHLFANNIWIENIESDDHETVCFLFCSVWRGAGFMRTLNRLPINPPSLRHHSILIVFCSQSKWNQLFIYLCNKHNPPPKNHQVIDKWGWGLTFEVKVFSVSDLDWTKCRLLIDCIWWCIIVPLWTLLGLASHGVFHENYAQVNFWMVITLLIHNISWWD